ncbi:MAG: SCE4755 family polysaccharide monooxygenase-like protein [Bdellovibrionota bacterium]
MLNKILLSLVILLSPTLTFAHTRLKPSTGILPRSTNSGIKSGPCGNLPASLNPPLLTGGQQLLVTWEETIEHPGRYEIYFSQANDSNFTLLATIPDVQGGAMPHQYSTTVTLPDVNCDNCTLQLIQVMTENPANPSLYYSCSDMKLIASSPNPVPPVIPPVCKPD